MVHVASIRRQHRQLRRQTHEHVSCDRQTDRQTDEHRHRFCGGDLITKHRSMCVLRDVKLIIITTIIIWLRACVTEFKALAQTN